MISSRFKTNLCSSQTGSDDFGPDLKKMKVYICVVLFIFNNTVISRYVNYEENIGLHCAAGVVA